MRVTDRARRALLEAQWRARLEEVTELSLAYHDAAAVTAPAPASRPADRSLRQLLRRAVAARRALADTDDALARLAAGRYGICEDCAAALPAWLLVVTPEARYCLRCRPKALAHRRQRDTCALNHQVECAGVPAGRRATAKM